MSRLLIVQYDGDWRAADARRRAGEGEVYYGHGYMLDQLAHLRRHGDVGILSALAEPHVETLPSGVTAIGAGADADREAEQVWRAIRDYDPSHLILTGPMMPLLVRALGQKDLQLGVVMADSFAHPYYRWVRFRRLPTMLNDACVTLVANHGVNAAKGLADLGVRRDKILAWDFPHRRTPESMPVKPAPGPAPHSLLYVGTVSAKKGVGDLIRAVARLPDVKLDIAGRGQVARFEALARRLGVAERVRFLGLIANDRVSALMHAADAVIVPSRHSFPEGLPLTLFEGLASRTPVIASDHPMFDGHLRDGASALVVPAGRPRALAEAIARLMRDPALYARLSAGSAAAWHHMQHPVKWGAMIDHWMADGPEDRAWLSAHMLAASEAAR